MQINMHRHDAGFCAREVTSIAITIGNDAEKHRTKLNDRSQSGRFGLARRTLIIVIAANHSPNGAEL